MFLNPVRALLLSRYSQHHWARSMYKVDSIPCIIHCRCHTRGDTRRHEETPRPARALPVSPLPPYHITRLRISHKPPHTRESVYLPSTTNSPPNRYDIMITNTCYHEMPGKTTSSQSPILFLQFKHRPPKFPNLSGNINNMHNSNQNNQPLKKIFHPKL